MKVVLQKEKIVKASDGTIYDFGYNEISTDCDSIEVASEIVQKFISDHNLGSSEFTGGDVIDGNKKVAYISYNARIWKPNSKYFK